MTTDEARGFRFRDTTRAPFESIVRLRYDRQEGADYARTSDLSMEGMFVESEAPKPIGTLVQFELEVPGKPEPIQGLGDVVWVRSGKLVTAAKPMGMGIQFRYVDPRSRDQIFQIVGDYLQRSNAKKAGGVVVDEQNSGASDEQADQVDQADQSDQSGQSEQSSQSDDLVTTASGLSPVDAEGRPAALNSLSSQGESTDPVGQLATTHLDPALADALRMERPTKSQADSETSPVVNAALDPDSHPSPLPPLSTAMGLERNSDDQFSPTSDAEASEDPASTVLPVADVIVDSGSTGESALPETLTGSGGSEQPLAGLPLVEGALANTPTDQAGVDPSSTGADTSVRSTEDGVLFRLEEEEGSAATDPAPTGGGFDPLATIAAPGLGLELAALEQARQPKEPAREVEEQSGETTSPAPFALGELSTDLSPKAAESLPIQSGEQPAPFSLDAPPAREEAAEGKAPTVDHRVDRGTPKTSEPVVEQSGSEPMIDGRDAPAETKRTAPSAALGPPLSAASSGPVDEESVDLSAIDDAARQVPSEFSLSQPIAAPPIAPPAPVAVEMPTEDQVSGELRIDPPRRVPVALIAALLLLVVAALAWWQRDLWLPQGASTGVEQRAERPAAPASETQVPSPLDGEPGAPAGPSEESAVAVADRSATSPESDPVAAGAASAEVDEIEALPRQASRLVEEDDPTAPTIPADRGARQVQGLQVDELGNSTLVRVVGDRSFVGAQIEVVSLESPPRFVVKIGGVGQIFRTGARGQRISRIRSGVHPGPELHLVLDLTAGEFETTADVVDGELLIGVEDL